MQYLNDEQYYIDRYDLLTINECLKVVEMFQNVYDKSLESKELKHLSKREKYKGANQMMYWHLWLTQSQEYKRKKETIEEWMAQDSIEQEKYDNTPEPQDIYCPVCKSEMHTTSTKHLEDFMDTPLRMMFMFRCTKTKCKKQEWVYEDGEVRVSKPDLCPKCNKEIEVTYKRKGQIITTKRKCSFCGLDTKIEDLSKSHEEYLKREKEEKELLAKYRDAFCLTDEMGKKFLENIEAIQFAPKVFEEEKRKYDNTPYEQVSKVKKLGIVDLEKLLSEALEKEKYIKLSFDKPEMEQFVFVPFTVQDADTSRRQNISTSNLQKILKDTLEGTNWRLMSEGVHYRLGYVSGKLKGYEREEDMLELFGKKKQQQQPVIDEEKRSKYSSNTWVQLAKMKGEHEGIEAMRKRGLQKEPEGFFLEGEGYYNCGICYEGHYGNEIWWNLDGIRCADCWRNIQEGVIPPLKNRLFDNEGEWISSSQLKSRHKIQPSLVRKLRKEGLLHGKDLKRANGSSYCTVYLVSENKEFLKKYPAIKKEEDTQMIMLGIEGKVVGF